MVVDVKYLPFFAYLIKLFPKFKKGDDMFSVFHGRTLRLDRSLQSLFRESNGINDNAKS